MIGLGFIIRSIRILIYCGIGAAVGFAVTAGLTWIFRLFAEGTEFTMRDHARWMYSKLPKWLRDRIERRKKADKSENVHN